MRRGSGRSPAHEDRTPTHGYEATREAAMAAFAKSSRRSRLHRPASVVCWFIYWPLVPRSIETPRWAGDVALDRFPTGPRAHGYFDLVALILLVDMRGNSGGTTDANASAEQMASRAIAVQAFQVGERWGHAFSPISGSSQLTCRVPAVAIIYSITWSA